MVERLRSQLTRAVSIAGVLLADIEDFHEGDSDDEWTRNGWNDSRISKSMLQKLIEEMTNNSTTETPRAEWRELGPNEVICEGVFLAFILAALIRYFWKWQTIHHELMPVLIVGNATASLTTAHMGKNVDPLCARWPSEQRKQRPKSRGWRKSWNTLSIY